MAKVVEKIDTEMEQVRKVLEQITKPKVTYNKLEFTDVNIAEFVNRNRLLGLNIEAIEIDNIVVIKIDKGKDRVTDICIQYKDAPIDIKNNCKRLFYKMPFKFIDFSCVQFRPTSCDEMFYRCKNLEEIYFGVVDTSKCTNMHATFSNCTKLNINLHGFDTSHVTDMHGMFRRNVGSIDISTIDTSSVTDMHEMFKECEGSIKLNLQNKDLSKVKNMSYMFDYCSALTKVDLSNKDLGSLINASGMFNGCNLKEVHLSNLNLASLKYIDYIFARSNIQSKVDIHDLVLDKLQSMGSAFYHCSLNKENNILDFSKVQINNVKNMQDAFSWCDASKIDLSNVKAANANNVTSLFAYSKNLREIIFPDLDIRKILNSTGFIAHVLEDCPIIELNIREDIKVTSEAQLQILFSASPIRDTLVARYLEATDESDTITCDNMHILQSALDVATQQGYKTYKLVVGHDGAEKEAFISQWDTSKFEVVTKEVPDRQDIKLIHVFGKLKDLEKIDKYDTIEINRYKESKNADRVWVYVALPEYITTISGDGLGIFKGNCWSIIDLSLIKIKLTSAKQMFASCDKLITIQFGELDTSECTDMSEMFERCNELVDLDINKLNTNSVTDMSRMFRNCYKFTKLDLHNFNTSKVENMQEMFNNCHNLKELDLSSFDTSNVKDMNVMFNNCRNLKEIDLHNFNTSKVENMSYMFSDCEELEKINLSSFDTSKVNSMSYMFQHCENIKALDVSNFNTSQVEDMQYMFYYCEKLEELDLSKFDTNKVKTMQGMFYRCKKLKYIDLSNSKISNMKDTSLMFLLCESIKDIKLPAGNNKITNMSQMFLLCENLESIDLSNFSTKYVKNMGSAFSACSKLEVINLNNVDTSNVVNMQEMFRDCSSLKKIDLSSFSSGKLKTIYAMFDSCSSLEEIDMSTFDTSQVKDMRNMFYYCESLKKVHINNFDTYQVKNMSSMFAYCKSLEELDISNFNTVNNSTMESMFYSCKSLKKLNIDTSKFDITRRNISGMLHEVPIADDIVALLQMTPAQKKSSTKENKYKSELEI